MKRILLLLIFYTSQLISQEAGNSLSLEQSIALALENYPSIKEAFANELASQSGIDLAKTSYLPKLDLLWQANRSTYNNITGSIFPQHVVSTLSGPVLPRSSSKTAWGSAAGALLAWEPFDFGLRQANVNLAKVQLEQALRESRLTEFNLVAMVIDSYIKILAAKQTVRVLRVYLERSETFVKLVETLVKSGLRPDVDLNRALTEMSSAKIQLIQAIENEKLALITLAQFIGISDEQFSIKDEGLLNLPGALERFSTPLEDHPILSLQEANIQHSQSKEISISRSYAPRVNLLAGISSRGSGLNSVGQIESNSKGLTPTRSNYGVGISITFGLMEYAPINAQRRIQSFNTQKEREIYNRLAIELNSKIAESKVAIKSSIEVAKQTPFQLEYSMNSAKQIISRYQAGLVDILEVTDVQRQLVQYDTENDLANLGVWRAVLNLSIALGDLNLFLAEVYKYNQKGKPTCGSSFQP